MPYRSLKTIIGKLELKESDYDVLYKYRDVFISKRDNFAEFFYNFFLEMPETRILLEHFGKPAVLKQVWSNWFERIFTEKPDFDFIAYLWRIGLKHVEVNLDQKYSNLGFSAVRQFIHRIARDNFAPEISVDILFAADKVIDFCVVIETSAYIDALSRCDVEILKGIADKIRNPVTIIGGNLRRLQRKADPEGPLFKDYDFLISYTSHCEDMVADINTYMTIFQNEAKFEKCILDTVIDNVLAKLSSEKKLEGVKTEVHLSPEARFVLADPEDIRHLFFHVIENAAEAARVAEVPLVRINSELQEVPPHTVRVEVFNNGESIKLQNIANILTPFYSTKSHGSGLGLSIAKLALRKNFGDMDFEPAGQSGTKVSITLLGAE